MIGWRSKLAATLVLFFVGLMGGRVADLLHVIGGTVERGARVTDQIRATVTTIERVDTAQLEAQIASLQTRLAEGTATPSQIGELRALVARLRGSPGPAGPTGPTGATGPPGQAAAEPAPTTTTGPGGTTTSSRPSSTTTTRPAPTTSTTRCAVAVGRLAKIGC